MLEAREIRLNLRGRDLLRGVSLSLAPASLACLIGPNGAGKTLLLETLAGLRRPSSGEALLEGKPVWKLSPDARARKLAFLQQRSQFFFPFPVEEVVAMGCFSTSSCSPLEIMDRVGILKLRESLFTEISEGERRMVLVARVLAQGTDFLLLDEPASNLDIKNQVAIYKILEEAAQEGKTVLVSEHNLSLATLCQQVYLIARGEIKERGVPREVLNEENIREVFGISTSDLPGLTFDPQGFPGPDSQYKPAGKKAGLPFPGPDGLPD